MSTAFLKRTEFILLSFLAVAIAYPHASFAFGLRTGFGKVVLEDVPAGIEYSMRKDSKFPLVIENNSERTIDLKLDVLVPKEEEIQEGYEAIPDAGWITLEKDSFIVEANSTAETDVVINVPNDERYIGRKFHVFIWSRTVGESLGLGIKSKLLFSVGEGKNN